MLPTYPYKKGWLPSGPGYPSLINKPSLKGEYGGYSVFRASVKLLLIDLSGSQFHSQCHGKGRFDSLIFIVFLLDF